IRRARSTSRWLMAPYSPEAVRTVTPSGRTSTSGKWPTASAASAIAEVADAVGHFPDVDVRPEGVTIRTASGEYGAMSQRDVDLARRISAAAAEMGLAADPSQVQVVGIAVAQNTDSDVGPFWAAALGYRSLGPKEDVVDRHRRNPYVSFQPLHPPKPGRGRTHIDVSVPREQAEARVAAALEAGGRLADDSNAPMWWTLASPENHGIDIAAWPDFEDNQED
ncbi:MAG TPA: VOC family protein, partial [Candidatus Limnocylindrales bacterium]|nr:VOC family protein [Candidatus Limnocylindrales bacterium]